MPDDVTLKEYVDKRFCALRDLLDKQMHERERAAAREVSVLDERLDKMNELQARFSVLMTRDEYHANHNALLTDIRRLEALLNTYVTAEAFRELQALVRVLGSWKENLSGKMWAVALLFGVFQIIITTAVGVVLHVIGGMSFK